jgi:hypothetical protein
MNWTSNQIMLNRLNSTVLRHASRTLPDKDWDMYGPEPAVYMSTLSVAPPDGVVRDTFIDMRGWGKGVVALNGFVLGRYWYLGPTFSLYVPAELLTLGNNDLVIFETDGIGAGCPTGRRRTHVPGELPVRPELTAAACRRITEDNDSVPTVTLRTVPVRDLPTTPE